MSDIPAVELCDVRYRYRRGGPEVLKGISLTVGAGTIMGLVGESGSGKSTLGRLIVNERQPTGGSILIEGSRWDSQSRKNGLRRSVQMVFQDPFAALNPYLTPVAAVTEAVAVADRQGLPTARERAIALLRQVGLSGAIIDRAPSSLSGGQRQRVVIARALACRPRILVADEATSALDVSVQAQILNLLMGLQRDLGLTMLFISHDISVIDHLTDEVAVLKDGLIVESGATEQILNAPQHDYTRALLSAFRESDREQDMDRMNRGQQV
ncbi:ATP-binding cassette domain-containing protein [Pseudarthrobacter sp. MEB009]|uniref:ABC transporter ATP-binding protein n=1 Tax=Pseudarthrobacter sp. MEB009 TaxID=3040326 RepID=UPI0025548400|nr:ATP-binding cassette domain-containing protein [Pseudarthrobacter sp. MEB009]